MYTHWGMSDQKISSFVLRILFNFLFKQCPQLNSKYTTPIFRPDISSYHQPHPTLLAVDISSHVIWSKPNFGSSSWRLRPVADSRGLSGLTRCFRLPALWSRCLRLLPLLLLLGHSRRQWRTSLTTKRTHQRHPESWSLGEDCDEGLGFNPTPSPWPREHTRLVCTLPNPNLQDDLLLHDADADVVALDASAGQLLPVGHWHSPLWAGHREGVHLSRRHARLKAGNSYVDRLHRPLQVATQFFWSNTSSVNPYETKNIKAKDPNEISRSNSTCRAANFETGLCVLFSSSALQYPGEYWSICNVWVDFPYRLFG